MLWSLVGLFCPRRPSGPANRHNRLIHTAQRSGHLSDLTSQRRTGPGLCFIVCVLVFALAGMVVGQIRTLQKFSWLANFSVWINLITMIIVMGLVAKCPPNYSALSASFGPNFGIPAAIQTFAGTPPNGWATGGSGFVAFVNGALQAVFAYGGAMMFPACMAEMRHPVDFWKGMICAQTFLTAVYLIFGMVVYHFQGQFTFIPRWACLIPVYWAIGFILAAAIPQLTSVSSLAGALFGLGFTYILLAYGALGYLIREDAVLRDSEVFDEASQTYSRVYQG